MKAGTVAAALLALALAGAAQAQIYRWTDEKGRVHYGEQPPAGAGTSTVKPPAPSAAPERREDLKVQDAEFKRRQVERREREEAEARAVQARQEKCDDAEDEIKLSEKVRLYRRDAGKKVFLTDEEHKAYVEKLKQFRAKNCR